MQISSKSRNRCAALAALALCLRAGLGQTPAANSAPGCAGDAAPRDASLSAWPLTPRRFSINESFVNDPALAEAPPPPARGLAAAPTEVPLSALLPVWYLRECAAVPSAGVSVPATAPFSTSPSDAHTHGAAAAVGEALAPRKQAAPDAAVVTACACGCGVFDVGTSAMLPQGAGGMVWVEYDYQNQNRNRRGSSSAPAAENNDKAIRTDYAAVGVQYMFNRRWGVQVQVPFDRRYFKSTDDDGNLASTTWTALGDIRVKALYSGFFEDQSVGVDFGVKLPTGDYSHDGADRDTQIGTGSTDLLLGGYYRTHLTADEQWNAFFQMEMDIPLVISNGYRPGVEMNGAAGVYYSGFWFHGVNIVPIAQVIGSLRTSDSGANSAHPVASGYQRVLLAPGIEFHLHPFMIYGDVELPVYQHVTGDQLTAPVLFKVIVSYSF